MTIFETDRFFRTDFHHSKLSRLGQKILARLAEHKIRRKLRDELANLSDHILCDVGLTRHDM